MIDRLEDADILITQFFPINKKVIDACKNLKVIGVLRGGYENINTDYAKRKNILVYNTPGRNSSAVADFTVGMLIAECRNIAKSHCNLKQGKWIREYANKQYVPDLAGKNAGIIGLGQIGKKVAQRLNAFDMSIFGYDPFAGDVPDYVKMDTLCRVVENADFLLLHSRLLPSTKHMINAKILNMMKPTAYLINTARSGLVDEKALYKALHDKKIAGAAIDVFDMEPVNAEYPFVRLDNVTVTPHLAGSTTDAFLNSPYLLAKEMLPYLSGDIKDAFIVNN